MACTAPRAAGGHDSHRSFLSRQNQAVQLPLFDRKAAIHREGPGDVAVVVVLQGTTGIDQQQVAVLKRCSISGVMQHAGVVSTGNDGAIGRPAGTVAAEGPPSLPDLASFMPGRVIERANS